MSNDYTEIILPAGVERAISVGSAILRDNIDLGNREPMYAVWERGKQEPIYIFNRISIANGPIDFIEMYEKPLPGNSGRTVAYVVTDAEIVGRINRNRPPVKERPKDQPAAAKSSSNPC